ncbi:hypothetical protein [Pararhizobium antarcticum]|uniref:Uncharacterized protein n=1 Tax=Pararhizobium antarcticum TaxID=1798805 RepID=A0A657LZI8_9HYPH|nr:hypothetical protein [Pararhizobium antarcticum]OJG01356.1 hypothetical protein AX760_00055 [Pararhizobium antarcticum]
MFRIFKAFGAAVIAFGIGFTAAVPAMAAPLMPVQIETKSGIHAIGHRGKWHRRQYYRHGYERPRHRNSGYRRHHRNGDNWTGSYGRRTFGHHRRHNGHLRFGIYFN